MIPYKHGFGHFWPSQGVGNEQQFIRIFKLRIKDTQFQKWVEHIIIIIIIIIIINNNNNNYF